MSDYLPWVAAPVTHTANTSPTENHVLIRVSVKQVPVADHMMDVKESHTILARQ